MAVQNSLTEQNKKPGFSAVINSTPYQRMINNTLKDRNTANRFIASIVSAVATTPALQKCEAKTIVSAALLGEGLKLSPSPQLGQFYLVPYNVKAKYDKNGDLISPAYTAAQFQMGYKGYIQLAIRSGQYKKINVLPIKEGELKNYNPLEEEIEAIIIEDVEAREHAETIGYFVMFELLNGFRKTMYWSKEKMLSHADKYVPAFSLKGGNGKVSFADYELGNYKSQDEWRYSSNWYQNFDDMACKTMIRQILNKWGVLSVEMQKAFESDDNIINISEDGTVFSAETQTEDLKEEPTNKVIDVPQQPETAEENEQQSFEEILEG